MTEESKPTEYIFLLKGEWYDKNTGRLVDARYVTDQKRELNELRKLRKNWKHAWELGK